MKIAMVALQPTDADQVRLHELRRALAAGGHQVAVESADGGAGGPAGRELIAAVPDFAGLLRNRWRRARPDVVHAAGWASGLAALSAAGGEGIPVVQALGPVAAIERRVGPGQVTAAAERLRLEPAIGRTAAAVVAWSRDEAAALAAAGVPRRAITVVPCGVDAGEFTPDGAAAPRGARRRLVMATSLAGHVAVAIRALPRLPGAELVVAGGPELGVIGADEGYQRLTGLAKALGVDDRVTFTGRVRRRRLPALLRSGDLMIATAGYEPDGMAMLEGMACGLPVVAAAAAGAPRDIIVEGTTGVLLPAARPDLLARQVGELLAHPMLLSGMSAAAADRARSRYRWERVAAETVAVCQRAAAGPGARPAV